jgi:hypothetical protein
MALSPEENLAAWIVIEQRARLGAAAAAEAMAAYIAERIRSDTLRRRKNAPGQYHKAQRGQPPAMGTGTLAESIYSTPASGGLRASAYAGSTDKRASLFEFGGCVLQAPAGSVMKWHDSGGWWSHHTLPLAGGFPEHPFIGFTTDEAIDDGELQRVALAAFRKYDP